MWIQLVLRSISRLGKYPAVPNTHTTAFIGMVQRCIFCLMLIHIVLTWQVLIDKADAPSEIWHNFADITDIQSYTSVSLSRHRNENKSAFCFVIAINARAKATTMSLHSSARFLVLKSFDLEWGEWHPALVAGGPRAPGQPGIAL